LNSLAERPKCSGDSPGHYQDGELIMSEFCDRCEYIFNIMQEVGLKLQNPIMVFKRRLHYNN
jgi:hypothetical protein